MGRYSSKEYVHVTDHETTYKLLLGSSRDLKKERHREKNGYKRDRFRSVKQKECKSRDRRVSQLSKMGSNERYVVPKGFVNSVM